MHKILKDLGLLYRANKIHIGDKLFANLKELRFIFIASDIGANMQKKIYDKCSYYKIPYYNQFSSNDLSKAIGKNNIKIIGISDGNYVNKLLLEIKEG